jgi:hypothetical protein
MRRDFAGLALSQPSALEIFLVEANEDAMVLAERNTASRQHSQNADKRHGPLFA